ncbi:MAG TPA: hypothetical protein VKT80_12270, partial [Chloroflexota bacterium]|nr:hypothetical protein [Chloroflexota bacterium]
KSPKCSNMRLGLLVVGGMSVLLVAAVLFMLYTRGQRGGKPLAEAPTLGYLSEDTKLILAWNPSAADSSKEARELMERIGFANGGNLDPNAIFGVKLDQVEDVVVGLNPNPIPDFRVIVRTKSSYDADGIRNKLGRTGSKQLGTKTVDTLALPWLPRWLPVEPVLWCATPRTLIICSRADDMQKIPDEPRANPDHLPAPIVELLKHRSDRDSFLWLVGYSEDWSKTLFALLKIPAEQRKTLFKVQSVGLALRPDSGKITSRARPARVTETVTPEGSGVALDLVATTRTDEDALDLRTLLDNWFDALKLDVRDSNLKETRFSATIAGSPKEFEQIVRTLRTLGKKNK